MSKLLAILAAVVVVDVVLLAWPMRDVNQVGVARAYRAYADNPTEENLRMRTEVSTAAFAKERQNAGIRVALLFVVTSGGAFIIGRGFERCQQRKRDEHLARRGTADI